MTALVLSALLLAGATPAGAARSRVDVRVTASDAAGDADAGLANALAQALTDAGLSAAPEHRALAACRGACVRVTVRRTADRGFAIEVRAHGDVAVEPVRLDPAASPFDQVHALAIEVELLAARAHPSRRRPARAIAAAASPPPPVSVEVEDAAAADEGAPPPEILPDPGAPRADDGPATAPAAPAAEVQARVEPKAAPADEGLALNVGAVVLAGTSGGLLMHGATVGIRLRLTHRLDARASISLLRAEDVDQPGGPYRLELLPLAAAVAVEIPGLPALHAGAGVEGLLAAGDRDGREGPSYWAIGPIARLEYRHAIRSFALMSSLQAALHPAAWSTADREAGPLVTVPRWTVGATLGLEFKVF